MNQADPSSPPTAAKGRGRRKREATEAEIIKAFDRLVRREGLRNVRVNAVIKEAGIGKALLYNYFGGLPGLVHAWGEEERVWPSMRELVAGTQRPGNTRDTAHTLKTLIYNHTRSLKRVPFRVELLADELMNPTPISEALSEVRRKLGREHQALFEELPELKSYDFFSLFTVLMAAASFLAMRAARRRNYMGADIGSSAGWNELMRRFERIIELAILGLEVDRKAKTKTCGKTTRPRR